MKNTLPLLFIVLFLSKLNAQEVTLKKQPTLTINFILNDYKTAQNIKNTSLSDVIKNGRFSSLSKMGPGASVTYLNGISKHIDLSSSLGGSFIDTGNQITNQSEKNKLLLEADANIIAKAFSDKHLIVPYVIAGLGLSFYNRLIGVYSPVGTGLQFNIGKGSFLIAQMQYRFGLTSNNFDHLNFSVGFGGRINRNKSKKTFVAKAIPNVPNVSSAPTVTSNEKDRDEDGIVDSKDKCPDIKGTLKYEGCPIPDTDHDGLNDEVDMCPKDSGSIRYKGCPVPDSDKDGLNDEEDNCPYIPGILKYKGCPIPDTDGDGINDEEDHCITQKGPVTNFGCPVQTEIITQLKKLATKIYFATGSAELLEKSAAPLNEVVTILKQDSTILLDTEGHTDNIGSDISNQVLSQKRAEAIVLYLKGRGINVKRLNAIGYGATKPITTNETIEGRAKNRRVELKLKFF